MNYTKRLGGCILSSLIDKSFTSYLLLLKGGLKKL